MRILTRTWQPLLYGRQTQHARPVLDAITGALREPLPAWALADTPPEVRRAGDVSLAGGAAGIAIFYSYLAEVSGDEAHERLAFSHLQRAMDAVAGVQMAPSLFAGFTGVAWAVQHLYDRHELTREDPVEGIDEALRDYLAGPGPFRDYDLVSGLVGLGAYALERYPRPLASECLELVVDRLAELAERASPGLAWPSPPAPPGEAYSGTGRYNLGLAHGVPGVISLLAQAWLIAPALRLKTEGMLARAVTFLLAQQKEDGSGPRFPYSIGPGATSLMARCAWCYGDLGIAAALLLAGRCLGEPSWERAAIGLARSAATFTLEQAQVVDAGLCHGAAGLAHLFNRLWQETGNEALQAAALRWVHHALSMRQEGQGVAGYQAKLYTVPGTPELIDDPGLLTGAAGIGLALLAATTNVEPDWDRMLLISGPRGGR